MNPKSLRQRKSARDIRHTLIAYHIHRRPPVVLVQTLYPLINDTGIVAQLTDLEHNTLYPKI